MQIRLATLNVWALPEPIGRDVSARVDAIGRRISSLDLDLITFQEVWTRDAGRRLCDAGRAAGLHYAWSGGVDAGGLLLLSRYPIDEVSFERFALQGEAERVVMNLEYLSGKGFATARIGTPAGPLLVVNTHLHARYSSAAKHRHTPHRTVQTIQMAARFVGMDEPVALLGDFNFREGEPDYQVLTEILGMADVAAALGNRQNTTLHTNVYRHASGTDRRKDYVFVRSGGNRNLVPRAVARSFDGRFEIDGEPANYSNHAGLIGDFEIQQVQRATRPAPAEDAFDLAERALAEGESLAVERRSGNRRLSAAGIGFAALAALSARPKRMSRRKLLRSALSGAAVLGLTPGVGFSIVSEVLVPDDIRTFRNAAAELARLRGSFRV
ncbi:MAG: endonuclease/exonuclease/phosphatase family protein [Deltaproteobacteria bacterium]|nr:endonuclease/exonuclease/phosphatase family protein [Deltaproteobacteria bacterium]